MLNYGSINDSFLFHIELMMELHIDRRSDQFNLNVQEISSTQAFKSMRSKGQYLPPNLLEVKNTGPHELLGRLLASRFAALRETGAKVIISNSNNS
jgi:hypothetical protein